MESRDKSVILALILISSLGVMSGSLIAPVEARFVNLLAKGRTELVGLVFSAGTLGVFLFSIYVGRKSVLHGKSRLALFGLLTGLLYPAVYATSINLLQYIFGKAIWSVAAVSSGMLINAIFQDMISARGDVAKISGYKFSAQSIAGTVGAVLGGFVADAYGVVAPYYLIIPLYLINIGVFLKWVYPAVVDTERKNKSFKEAETRKIWESLRDIMSNPYLFLRFFTEGVTQSHWAMEPIIFPLLIYSITGSDASTGIVFGAMGIIAMFLLPLTGKLIDKTSPITGLKIAFILYIIALLLLSSVKNYSLFFIGALILSAGKTFNGPAMAKIEVRYIKNDVRGEYLGYFNAYDTITGVAAAIITGYLLKLFDYWEVLFIFAGFTFVGFVLGFLLFKLKLRKYKRF
jgi:MFS family permease